MADPRVLLATAIDDSAEALYRIVADIRDPVARARAALSAVDRLPDSGPPATGHGQRPAGLDPGSRWRRGNWPIDLVDVPIAGVRRAGQRGQTRPIR